MAKVSKSAIQLASDLEEVQNVVDVTFGEASGEVEQFAKTCITQFGLSELSAKRFASQFMAMSNSMGITRSEGKNMSLMLTQLAGDMASFYNVEQDIAKTALDSVFTGETESLKKFGVVLTEANLKAHALEKGITKSYSAMSQAEKVALRYSYVLKATQQVQGDFARTSTSWANQIRILKEQWNQLLIILGRGLVTVLRPIVVVLNKMLASLIAVANAIAKAFGGSGISSSTGQVEDLNASIGDTGTGFEDANTEAKKLAKTIAGFDELEILASNEDNSNSSSGTGGGTSAGVIGSGTVIESPEVENPAEKFKKYLEECKKIIDKWIKQIPKLEFKFDKEKAIKDLGNIGKNLLNTIMGWGTFFVTIGIKVANDLNIGQLTNDFLALVESATNLASKMTDVLVPAFINFYEIALKPVIQWIGEKFSDGMKTAKDILDSWAEWFETNREKIYTFSTNVGLVVAEVADLLMKIGDTAWEVFKNILWSINDALQSIAEILISLDANQLKALLAVLTASGIATKVLYDWGKKAGYTLKDAFLHPVEYIKNFGNWLNWVPWSNFNDKLNTSVSRFKKLFTTLASNPIAQVVAVIALLTAAFITAYQTNDEFRAKVDAFYEETLKPFFEYLGETVEWLWNDVLKPLWDALKPVLESAIEIIKVIWDILAELFAFIGEIVGQFLTVVLPPLLEEIKNTVETVKWLVDIVVDVLEVLFDTIANILDSIKEFISGHIDAVKKIFEGIIEFITGVFTGDWEKAWEGVREIFEGVFDGITNFFKGIINGVIDLINGFISGANKIGQSKIATTLGLNFTIGKIPKLASGGVISMPTVAMMGEYPGASNNPEIVTPSNLLREIVAEGNGEMVNAFYQIAKEIITAIDNVDMDVRIGDDVIAQSAKRGNDGYKKRTGKPLFV